MLHFFSPKSCDLCHVTFYAKKQSSFCWDFSLLCYKVTIYFLYIVLHCLPLFVLFLLNVSIECPLCSDVMLFALFILYSHFRITESVISHLVLRYHKKTSWIFTKKLKPNSLYHIFYKCSIAKDA